MLIKNALNMRHSVSFAHLFVQFFLLSGCKHFVICSSERGAVLTFSFVSTFPPEYTNDNDVRQRVISGCGSSSQRVLRCVAVIMCYCMQVVRRTTRCTHAHRPRSGWLGGLLAALMRVSCVPDALQTLHVRTVAHITGTGP